MDSLKQSDIDKMDEGQKLSYDARSQIGDIVVVRPDGWKWGKEECPPNFIVVKVPQMTLEEADIYEEPLIKEITNKDGEIEHQMIKHRKYALPKVIVDNAKVIGSVSLAKTVILSKIITKVE